MESRKQRSDQEIKTVTVYANEDLEAMPTVKVDKGMFPAVQVMVTTIDEEDANEPVDDDVADKYYNTRSYESRIGAWASKQSTILKERKDFELYFYFQSLVN